MLRNRIGQGEEMQGLGRTECHRMRYRLVSKQGKKKDLVFAAGLPV